MQVNACYQKMHASSHKTVLRVWGEGRKQHSSWCLQQTESLPLLSLHSTWCFPLRHQLPSASLRCSARCAKQKQVHGHMRPCQRVWLIVLGLACKWKSALPPLQDDSDVCTPGAAGGLPAPRGFISAAPSGGYSSLKDMSS